MLAGGAATLARPGVERQQQRAHRRPVVERIAAVLVGAAPGGPPVAVLGAGERVEARVRGERQVGEPATSVCSSDADRVQYSVAVIV